MRPLWRLRWPPWPSDICARSRRYLWKSAPGFPLPAPDFCEHVAPQVASALDLDGIRQYPHRFAVVVVGMEVHPDPPPSAPLKVLPRDGNLLSAVSQKPPFTGRRPGHTSPPVACLRMIKDIMESLLATLYRGAGIIRLETKKSGGRSW